MLGVAKGYPSAINAITVRRMIWPATSNTGGVEWEVKGEILTLAKDLRPSIAYAVILISQIMSHLEHHSKELKCNQHCDCLCIADEG
jgi:hypothetical protein